MLANHVDDTHVAALAQPEALRREVERACLGVSSADAVVAFRRGENVASVCIRDGRLSTECRHAPIKVGCIAKLLTATLARRAFETGSFAPDDGADDLLRGPAERRTLRGVTVRQLLEHAHGLDDSLLEEAPRLADSRIDVEALVRMLRAAPALAPPGALYSYGSSGAWLTAALLERCTGRSYSAQVREEILAPLGVRGLGSGSAICPATGGALALDPADLLRVVAHAALQSPNAWPEDDRHSGAYGPAFPLPGWNPLERGVHLGWKYHGQGWFGHQSLWPAASVLVRAHPRRALALVVASRVHSAAVVAARVFGAHLPELFDLRVPARPSAVPPGDQSGTFASAAWHVKIHDRKLYVRRRGERGLRHASLHHIAGGVSFTRPGVESFPHVELLAPGSEGIYLWNGRFVLRKSDP